LEAIDKPTLESARAVLERKAKIYDKLKKGKTGGLSENQYNSLLVDVSLHGYFQQRFVTAGLVRLKTHKDL